MMILAVLCLAVYGLVVRENLIRKVMCLSIIESLIIMTFLTTGYTRDAAAPILVEGVHGFVDPVPQALMLTAIVIGVCFNSLAVAVVVKTHHRYGTIEARYFRDR